MRDAPRHQAMTRAGILALTALAGACASAPPDNPANACAVFAEKKEWWDAVRDSERRWGVPAHVQLAVLNQESSFDGGAKPPRKKFLWVIPTPMRESSARGYAQATESTWDWYKREEGSRFARRNSFRSAAYFVGWYGQKSYELSGIDKDDAYNLYLAYHEGHGGYNRGTWRSKPDVRAAADRVAARAETYRRQIRSCRRDLDRHFLWIF
jgi:hypothetical protein